MGMLDRYKKKSGFSQLLALVETSGKQKQDQFLGLIAQESPAWEKALRTKILSAEAIFEWPQEHLSEILSRLQPLTLAMALHGTPTEKFDQILGCLPNSTKRKISELMNDKTPSPAEKMTCLMKVVTEVREFIKQGIVKLEKIDPNLVIPENIEDLLASGSNGPTLVPNETAQSVQSEPKEVSAASIFETGAELKFENRVEQYKESERHHASMKEEVDFLKKKVNTLSAENSQLKQEVNVLRNKLDQIRRIA